MTMPRPEVNWRNPNLARNALITLLVLAGASLIAQFVSNDEPTLTNSSDNTALITPLPTEDNSSLDSINDGIFQREYFGYSVLCGMLNTSEYGHPKTVDHSRPIFSSASEIFEEMGDRVDQDTKVMVIKGPELSFRDTKNGILYTVDANKTAYCLIEKK